MLQTSRGDTPEAPTATALLAAWTSFPAVTYADNSAADSDDVDVEARQMGGGGRVAVVMHGHIRNAQEMRELYGLPPAPPPSANGDINADGMPPPPPTSPGIEGAQLILDLYGRRFEDKDGDPSDQPATALTACEGSFSFVLVDAESDAVLIARSAESDTHPLYWGTAPSNPAVGRGTFSAFLPLLLSIASIGPSGRTSSIDT